MKTSIIAFTRQGSALCAELVKRLGYEGISCKGYILEKYFDSYYEIPGLAPLRTSLKEWTKEQFEQSDAILFIGAAGIAVRAIAPFIKSKTDDPAVVVMDEKGQFSISLLSGHLGGANELAELAAIVTGAEPVITTATDVHGVFAVDVFAKKQNLAISDMNLAKHISAAVLDKEPVGLFSDFPVTGIIPEGLTQKKSCKQNIWITVKKKPESESFLRLFLSENTEVLRLIPSALILGIGCRKGTGKEAIETVIDNLLEQWNLSKEAVAEIATIDIKKNEKGLLDFAHEHSLKLSFYSSERLMETEGEFTPSEFVKQITGVDNVCERAAMTRVSELGGGTLLVRKQAENGVTAAIAVKDWKVTL